MLDCNWSIIQAGNLFVFVMNNPIYFIDPSGLNAQAAREQMVGGGGFSPVANVPMVVIIGSEFTISLLIAKANFATGTIFDSQGNMGSMNSMSAGLTVNTGVSIGAFTAFIAAPNINNVQGGSIEVGASVSVHSMTLPGPKRIALDLGYERGFEITVSLGGGEQFRGYIMTQAVGVSAGTLSLPSISFTPHVQATYTNVREDARNPLSFLMPLIFSLFN